MNYSNLTNRALLLLLPFLFTGCYTQFQTFDDYPAQADRNSNYYSWEGSEEGRASEEPRNYQQKSNPPSTSYYEYEDEYNEEQTYLDEELALEEQGIYYKDFETERWYRENYANKMYWEGYSVGYDDGFYDGNRPYYPYSSRYSFSRYRYTHGYTGSYGYYDFYRHPRYASSVWIGLPYTSFFFGFNNLVGLSDPYYYGYYYGNYAAHPFYSYNYAYNRYYKAKKYKRNADVYRKGPRNSGLRTRGDYRSRSNDNRINRSKRTGVTRSRSTGSRVRTSSSRGRSGSGSVKKNSSRTRGSKVKSSGKSRSRGSSSSVGRSRSGNNSRSRGSGSSVGKSRSGNKSSSRGRGSSVKRSRSGNKSSKGSSRSRSKDYSSRRTLPGTSVRTIDISDFDGRSYSIPTRKVGSATKRTTSRRTSGLGGFLNRTFTNISTSSPTNVNSRSSYGKSRSKSSGSVTRSSSRSSRSAKVSRSSSSSRSRSSGTRSSSGSSKKRSRGNN